jgi:hypothetical protein
MSGASDLLGEDRRVGELLELCLDPVASGEQHVVGVHVVSHRQTGGLIGEAHARQPDPVLAPPRLPRPLIVDLPAQ